jgi:hypothetical protein
VGNLSSLGNLTSDLTSDLTSALNWTTIHPSVYHHAAGPLRAVEATPRPQGALRYQCPVNGSLVLVTDEATLANLDRPRARLRCIDCGEIHLLTQASGR